MPATINIFITSKPFILNTFNPTSESSRHGTSCSNFWNAAFGKQKNKDSLSAQKFSYSKLCLRKCIFKALQDSDNGSDVKFTTSRGGNAYNPGESDPALQKNTNEKHIKPLKSIPLSSDCNDIADIKVSDFLHRPSITEADDKRQTEISDLFYEKVVQDPNGFLVDVLEKLEAVRLHALALEQWNAPRLKECNRIYSAGAKNLIHYVSSRTIDIHQLQEALTFLGLSNLDGSNSHILTSLTSVIKVLEKLTQQSPNRIVANEIQQVSRGPTIQEKHANELQSSPVAYDLKFDLSLLQMKKQARRHMESLLGSVPSTRQTHIMVTVGTEGAEENIIEDLIKSGVSIVRINCAHDNPDVWVKIIWNVRKISRMLERPCRVLMDLAGPKLRTGTFSPGPKVRRIKPHKDSKGIVIAPACIWIAPSEVDPPPHKSVDAVIPVDDRFWISLLESGNVLKFTDARGKKCSLKITETFPVSSSIGCFAETYKTAYVETGTKFLVKRKKHIAIGEVNELPAIQQYIRVRKGELLVITRDSCLEPSSKLREGASGPARVTCSSGVLFDSVKPGEPIEFDDGKIRGVIRGVNTSEVCLEITHAGRNGSRLGPEKSINVPKSKLLFEGFTVKDLMDLDFIGSNADMVGISFVNSVNDVSALQQELRNRGLRNLGIVLKIETRSGFESLPLLLLQAMRSTNPVGVMIARGDLAVECGWERLAEMQEEILSICEAAHVPCIWATQVLENLAKSGLPTRAEVTDAAAASRSACIMLNKGKHIIEAVVTLDSILRRTSMQLARIKPVLKPLLFSSLF